MFRIVNNIISLQAWRDKKGSTEKISLPVKRRQAANKDKVGETAATADRLIKKNANQGSGKARFFINNNRLLSYVQEEITLLQKEDKEMWNTEALLQGMQGIFLSLGKPCAPIDSLRINNSLRQLDAAISRISRQRSSLEDRVSNLRRTVELLYLGKGDHSSKGSADSNGSTGGADSSGNGGSVGGTASSGSMLPSGNADNVVNNIWESLNEVKEQILRENSMAVMAQINFDQQRVLRLLDDKG